MATSSSISTQPHTVTDWSIKQEGEVVLTDTNGCSHSASSQRCAGDQEANKENVNKELDLPPQEQTREAEDGLKEEDPNEEDNSPVIDIVINNVVCTFSLRCHINLKRLAMEGSNVEYKRSHGICNMKLRRPNVTANVTSSGKVTVTGSTSEAEAKVAARRVARRLQRLGFNVRFSNFRIVNVLGTCSLPFGIKLNQFSIEHPQHASYEPELHPGVTYKLKDPKATLKIFSTGSITITAPCVTNVGLAVEHIYPLVSQFQMEKRENPNSMKARARRLHPSHQQHAAAANGFHHDDDEDEDDEFDEFEDGGLYDSELDDDSFDSDVSHD